MAFSESRGRGDVQADSSWLNALMSRCQMLVGQLRDPAPTILIADLGALFVGLPEMREHLEEIVVRIVFSRMLSSVIKCVDLDEDAQIQRGFIELTNSSTFDDWRREWLTIMKWCAAAPRPLRTNVRGAVDVRVSRMLNAIDRRHAEFGLSLRDVAREVSLSVDHAALLLKHGTGAGFGRHLRRVRIAAARELLLTSSLCIKEIAAAVGYKYACQLSRNFKIECASTPAAFRWSHDFNLLR
jgi:YesN/AraC family two-component response regulator